MCRTSSGGTPVDVKWIEWFGVAPGSDQRGESRQSPLSPRATQLDRGLGARDRTHPENRRRDAQVAAHR